MLKALELEPTLPDWRLHRVVAKRTWTTCRSGGLYAVVVPGKKQDPQGMTVNQGHRHTSIYLLWKGVSRDPVSFPVLI